MRILIIEDERVLSNTIRDFFKEDFEIDQAFDGCLQKKTYMMQLY